MRFLFKFLALLAFSMPICAYSAQKVIFGISEFASHKINEPIIQGTISILEQTLGKDNLEVRFLNLSQLQNAARNKQLDLILSSAGTFRRLVIEGAGLRDLATVASSLAPNPNFADGSVFFVKTDSPIKTFENLKGKTVAASYPYAFAGWQTALGEIFGRGYELDGFFKEIKFLGHGASPVVHAVLSNQAEVGVIRNCFLEASGLLKQGTVRVIGAKKNDSSPCLHSTDLYPNWTIATTPNTPPEISRKVAAALLEMKPLPYDVHWSVATDFTGIDKLFLNLKIGPYEYLRHFNLQRFLSEYWAYIALCTLALFALILHSIRSETLVKKRTNQLSDSLKREKALGKERTLIKERLNGIERSGIIGQMSTMLAHELKQPLGSLSNYCFTMQRLQEAGELSLETVQKALPKMSKQITKASDIVNQVRDYAKGERKRQIVEPTNIIQKTIEDISRSNPQVKIQLSFNHGESQVEINELELQIVILNLVKNAIEATKSQLAPKVEIQTSVKQNHLQLSIEDNGNELNEKGWEELRNGIIKSKKEGGLGLGLSIVRSIIEDCGGRLEMLKSKSLGVVALVSIPLSRKSE